MRLLQGAVALLTLSACSAKEITAGAPDAASDAALDTRPRCGIVGCTGLPAVDSPWCPPSPPSREIVCHDLLAVPVDCSPAPAIPEPLPNIHWCCPTASSDDAGRRHPEDASPGPFSPAAGCTAVPAADWICRAQGIGVHAVVCDVAAPSYLQSAYDANGCEPGNTLLYCAP